MDPTTLGFTTSQGIRNVTPREAALCCADGAILLDVREEYTSQVKRFVVPRVLQIPMSRLVQELEQIPNDTWIIIADSVGLHSKEAYLFMLERGFEKILNLAGGIVDWERDGLPLTTDNAERLSGSCACQLKPRERQKSRD
jgi:rhodanese-related sulfurtransferase